MLLPDTSTPARRTAVGIETGIRGDSLETGVLIAPDGSVLVNRQGQPNRVTLTVGELSLVSGATFTHNHPDDSGPSVDDVALFAQYELAELRVVTPTVRYIVTRRFGMPLSVSGILAAYSYERPRVEQAVTDDVRASNVNLNDFWREVVHRLWTRLAPRNGFTYLREQS